MRLPATRLQDSVKACDVLWPGTHSLRYMIPGMRGRSASAKGLEGVEEDRLRVNIFFV